MVRAEKFMLFGCALFLMVFSFALVSANTLVGGKIYNSDFSQVIEGADVSVQCGTNTLETASLNDGAYAVIFDSESCPLGSKVYVSTFKGSLSNEGSSNVYNSDKGDGEFVSVVNLNLKSKQTASGSIGSTRHTGWFECGNTVCDSGESYSTCPTDCPQPQETPVPLTTNTETSNSNPTDSNPESAENTTTNSQTSNSGITGAVTGDNSGKKSHLAIILAALVLFLIIVIALMASMADMKQKKNKKLGAELAQVNVQ